MLCSINSTIGFVGPVLVNLPLLNSPSFRDVFLLLFAVFFLSFFLFSYSGIMGEKENSCDFLAAGKLDRLNLLREQASNVM